MFQLCKVLLSAPLSDSKGYLFKWVTDEKITQICFRVSQFYFELWSMLCVIFTKAAVLKNSKTVSDVLVCQYNAHIFILLTHTCTRNRICSKSWSLNILCNWFFFLSVCLNIDIWRDMLCCRHFLCPFSWLCGQMIFLVHKCTVEFVLKAWKGNKNG